MSHNFSSQYRIYYEDTDAGGLVYYANYLKFFERNRTDFLRHIGIIQSQLLQENLAFVVRKCEIEYILPAKLDDLIKITVKITKINGATITMEQEITKSDKILSRLKVDIIHINSKKLRPVRIPQTIKDLINVR